MLKKKYKKVTTEPIVYEVIQGLDLLQAIEPLLLEALPLSKKKDYAAWLLRCLRQELEGSAKAKKDVVPNSPFSYGSRYWLQNAHEMLNDIVAPAQAENVAPHRMDYVIPAPLEGGVRVVEYAGQRPQPFEEMRLRDWNIIPPIAPIAQLVEVAEAPERDDLRDADENDYDVDFNF